MRLSTNNQLSIKLLGLGAIQFGLMYWAYIQSYQHLPGYLVAVFTIFTPIYVYLLHSLITKTFSSNLLLVVIASIIGAAIIVFKAPKDNTWLTGFAILQVANIAFALGQVGYKRLAEQAKSSHLNNMAIMYVGAAIFMLIAVLFEQSYVDIPQISTRQWAVLLYLGVIASGLGFAAWNYGAKKVSAQKLAVMNNGYIPFAVLFSVTIFNEQADLSRLFIGAAIIFCAVWWLEKEQVRGKYNGN